MGRFEIANAFLVILLRPPMLVTSLMAKLLVHSGLFQ